MQLMLRAISMEKIMSFYSNRGWDQAGGQMDRSPPEYLQWAGSSYDQGSMGRPESIGQSSRDPQTTPQPCRPVMGLASSRTVQQDGAAKHDAPVSNSAGSLDSAHRPDDGEDGHWDGNPRAQREMVYAGDAHCAALAKLLREAQ